MQGIAVALLSIVVVVSGGDNIQGDFAEAASASACVWGLGWGFDDFVFAEGEERFRVLERDVDVVVHDGFVGRWCNARQGWSRGRGRGR